MEHSTVRRCKIYILIKQLIFIRRTIYMAVRMKHHIAAAGKNYQNEQKQGFIHIAIVPDNEIPKV